MTYNNSCINQFILLVICGGLIACTQSKPPVNTMRVCDDSGCNERPKNYATFEPATSTFVEDEKIVALEKLAAADPRAAFDLALRFFRSDGVRQDSYRSIKWMREAAEKGHLEAQKALGRLYFTGLAEMGADYAEAQKWLSITASRGDKEAIQLLAEATAERKNELAEYRYYSRWRPVFYNYWNSGYNYYWGWGNTGWYLY